MSPFPRLIGPPRLAVLLLPLLAVVALATACGGSSKASSATTSPGSGNAPSGGFAAARAKYTGCLEAHGVPASQATGSFGFRRGTAGSASSTSTPPTTTAAYAAAAQACRSDLPTRGTGGFQNSAAGRAYLQCLQLHGVTVPTNPAGGAPRGSGAGAGGFSSNPNFQAARQACASLAPSGSGGPTSSTSAAA